MPVSFLSATCTLYILELNHKQFESETGKIYGKDLYILNSAVVTRVYSLQRYCRVGVNVTCFPLWGITTPKPQHNNVSNPTKPNLIYPLNMYV